MSRSVEFGLLLIAGSHTHQENYARAFQADPRCRLVGLTDEREIPPRRRELNQRLAEELNIPWLPNWEEALARDDVDLVSVCAEPERRAKLAVQCARAGKHLYMDKPLTTTTEDALQLVKAVEENGVRGQVFSLVRMPMAQRAKSILESGELGDLLGLHCELLFAKGIAGTADLTQRREEKPEAERFTFIDSKRELYCVGWYPLILFQWLTGSRFTDVAGTTANYFFAEHQKNNVEDFSNLLLGMEQDIEATITVGRSGWSSHPTHGVHQLHLVGTKDCVTLDAHSPRFEVWSDAPPWRQPSTPHPEDPMGFWSSTQAEGGVQG
ncbi:MAG: Gfo/Idh/MocA family oxidoreductase [Planctomycetaceae bacterium]|nr:Gfo/Idh/MocA family oxidoreductase [Planctomycetaceae bacterium]